MEIQAKHKVELLNAKCNIVCAADTILQKMNYGEDIGCCVTKLTSAIQLINRLDCYCFDGVLGEETVLAKFTAGGANSGFEGGTKAAIIIDERQAYNKLYADVTTKKEIVNDTLIGGGLTIDSITGTDIYSVSTTAFDDTRDVQIQVVNPSGVVSYITFTNTVLGVESESNCHNCFPESRLNKMYALVNTLIS